MSIKNFHKNSLVYKTLMYSVLFLSATALVAEMLPEVKAKMIVIPTLILIIITCTIDLVRLRKEVT